MNDNDMKRIRQDMERVKMRLKNLEVPLNPLDAYIALNENRVRVLANIRALALKGDTAGASKGIEFLRESFKLISTLLGSKAVLAQNVLDDHLHKVMWRLPAKPFSGMVANGLVQSIDEAIKVYSVAVGA